MSKILIVSRVSSRKQRNESQINILEQYCSSKGFVSPNRLDITSSAYLPGPTAAYHTKILRKLREMRDINRPTGGIIENFTSWVLGEQNYKIIFTDPNRLSRNVNLLREFFRNLGTLGMKVDFIFIECDEANFTYDDSVENPENVKLWEVVETGERASREKSRMAEARSLAINERLENNKITNKYSWITLYNFVKETLRQGENFETIRNTIRAFYNVWIPFSHLMYYNTVTEYKLPDTIHHTESDELCQITHRIQCNKCGSWRWVPEEMYREHSQNPESPFTCSRLIHCSCSIPMIYEDDPDYEPDDDNDGDEPDGGGGPVTKRYDLNYIIESRFSMNHDEYIYHVKWKRLRKNNPAWYTETQLIGWGLGRYLDLYKKKNDEFFNPDSKRARK